jgi:peptidoglycan hydrolase-like protein with peptidoglycan-binding domain
MEPPRVEEPHEAVRKTWVPDGASCTGTGSPSAVSNTRRRRRLAGGGVLVLAIAVVVVVVLTQSHSAAQNTTGTGVPAGDTTAEVTSRTLTESSTVDGTLGYGSTLELYDRVAGTFTWLPAVGAVIARSGTLWRVNNEPVALMYGPVPAYRTLKEDVSKGPDVVELNQNLTALGYDPYGAITGDEVFGEATAAAVRRWQKAEGLSETGEVELGRVIFAPGARRVTAVKVALGQDPPGGAGAKEPAAGTKEEPAAGTKGKPAGSKEPAKKNRPAKKHQAKKEPTKESPSKESPAKESPGSGAGAGMPVLTTTSTQQLVQVKLKAEQQTLARVGRSAPVTLPGGDVVRGRIIDVGSVASAASEGEKEKGGGGGEKGEGESATIGVTLTLEHRLANLDEAPVSVELVKSIRRNVLAVPATALTATAGGGYAIETLQGRRRVALAVTPGMFANGYVQIEGAGVREGLTVIESQ